MRFIIGTGCCGFQRIHHMLNRMGHNTLYKVSPIKMQNSIQVNYDNFIRNSWNNNIVIGPFYLRKVEDAINRDNSTKIICLKGDKKKTIESLFIHFGFRNPLISDRSKWTRYNLDFFPDYSIYSNSIDAITKYYDDYYNTCEELKSKYPNNIMIVESKKYF